MFQVEDIETKLDILIDLYKEDRKILLQKLSSPTDSNTENKELVNKQIPRSILVDKQYSEPSSPIVNRPPKRFMQRNHSDLSSRIRKRVTYRLHSSPVCNSAQDDKSLIPENNIPRSLSASYPSRTKFYDSEESNNESGKTVTNETEEHQESDNVKPVSNNVLVIPQNTFPMDPGKSENSGKTLLDLPSYSDCVKLSNSQHSLLDDPFSPEDETQTLINDLDNRASPNQTTSNQSKSQESEHAQSYSSDDNHQVLLPIGTMKALSADVTDV